MYLARTFVRTAHVLKWRQNRQERFLIEFVYFTLFVHNFCILHNFYAIHKSRQPSYVTHSVFGCGNQMQINDGKSA